MQPEESDQTFHPFPRLPNELKRKIFRHALKRIPLVSLEGECGNDIAWLRLRPKTSFRMFVDDGKLADAFPEYLGDAKITRFASDEDDVVITEDPNYRTVQLEAADDHKQRIEFPIEQFDTKRQTLFVNYDLLRTFHKSHLEIDLRKVNYLAVSVEFPFDTEIETDLEYLCRFIQNTAPDLKELYIVICDPINRVEYRGPAIGYLVAIDGVFRNEAQLYFHPVALTDPTPRITLKFRQLCDTASAFHDMYEKFCKDANDEEKKFWAKRQFSLAVFGERFLEPASRICDCRPTALFHNAICEYSHPFFIGQGIWIETLDCSAPCDINGILSSKYEGIELLFEKQAELDLASGKEVEWCYDGIQALFGGET